MKNVEKFRKKAESLQTISAVSHSLFMLEGTEFFPCGSEGSYPSTLLTRNFTCIGRQCESARLTARIETVFSDLQQRDMEKPIE